MKHLDPFGETEEEYHEEQRLIHHAQRNDSFDSEDLTFPNRAEFRPQGLAHELAKIRHSHVGSTSPL